MYAVGSECPPSREDGAEGGGALLYPALGLFEATAVLARRLVKVDVLKDAALGMNQAETTCV